MLWYSKRKSLKFNTCKGLLILAGLGKFGSKIRQIMQKRQFCQLSLNLGKTVSRIYVFSATILTTFILGGLQESRDHQY